MSKLKKILDVMGEYLAMQVPGDSNMTFELAQKLIEISEREKLVCDTAEKILLATITGRIWAAPTNFEYYLKQAHIVAEDMISKRDEFANKPNGALKIEMAEKIFLKWITGSGICDPNNCHYLLNEAYNRSLLVIEKRFERLDAFNCRD